MFVLLHAYSMSYPIASSLIQQVAYAEGEGVFGHVMFDLCVMYSVITSCMAGVLCKVSEDREYMILKTSVGITLYRESLRFDVLLYLMTRCFISVSSAAYVWR